MKKGRLSCLALALTGLLLHPSAMRASIFGNEKMEINFTRVEDATNKADWAVSGKVGVTPNGFGRVGKPGQGERIASGWFQTKPLAIGVSWRPAREAAIRVKMSPAPSDVLLQPGFKHTPGERMFARYSPDFKHWSSWQALAREKEANGTNSLSFSGELAVPAREHESFEKYQFEYYKQDVPWISDEEALVVWILQREPEYFAQSLPFIGYVAFLFEGEFAPDWKITDFRADVSYGVGGMSSIPRDADAAKGREGAWRFKAP
jgi:hypothetical protein